MPHVLHKARLNIAQIPTAIFSPKYSSIVRVPCLNRPVNPTDLVTAAGGYPGTAERVPFTVGSEGANFRETPLLTACPLTP